MQSSNTTIGPWPTGSWLCAGTALGALVGLIGMGLCWVGPGWRGEMPQWPVGAGSDQAVLEQWARAASWQYAGVSELLLRLVLPCSGWGLVGGAVAAGIVSLCCRPVIRQRWWWLSAAVGMGLLLTLLPGYWPWGLVQHAGRNQFEWLEQLRSDVAGQREAAVQASIELLKLEPFPGRAQLISALAEQGDAALGATPVLSSLRHDREVSVQEAATIALQRLNESWSRQIDQVRGGISKRIELSWRPVTSEEFRELLEGMEGLESLLLDQLEVDTTTLCEVLPRLPRLRRLKLGCPVGSELLAVIGKIETLETLNLPDCQIADADLALLGGLSRLNLLRLGAPAMTDAGLLHLQGLPGLKYLHLVRSSVTDAGLPIVQDFPQLQSFYVDNSPVTEPGLAALLRQRPDLHIHWNELHLDGDESSHSHH